MEESATRAESSVTLTEVDGPSTSQPVLRLRLKKPKSDRKVIWCEGTIDNENMGKRKSKCCCIYKKPTKFCESSSEDDEECGGCYGHPEKRKRNKNKINGTAHLENNDDDRSDGHKCDIAKDVGNLSLQGN